MKVYCEDCKHLILHFSECFKRIDYDGELIELSQIIPYDDDCYCITDSNIRSSPTWYRDEMSFKKKPKEKNANNDCSDYKHNGGKKNLKLDMVKIKQIKNGKF